MFGCCCIIITFQHGISNVANVYERVCMCVGLHLFINVFYLWNKVISLLNPFHLVCCLLVVLVGHTIIFKENQNFLHQNVKIDSKLKSRD